MTQLSVMELAKQGDPQAIAALINRSLASKGIHAEAELKAECLIVSLYAAQIPNQKAVVTIIHRGMMILQVEQIKHVKILTYRSDNNYLAWQNEIDLGNNPKEVLPISQIADTSYLEQVQNMNLVKNQKGIILVQNLSQIQQNLQEYQDIIVRFTDEQVGTVRCLTTLTELIQVISKPSFLFAAVASNPNLRSLLDTIAESSQTDENGDQVITNLSILQPGQQWQKAKIRLVSKIFLEPAEDQNAPEDKHQGLTLDLEKPAPQPIVYPETNISNLENLQIDSENPQVDVASLNTNSENPQVDVASLNTNLDVNVNLESNSDSITADSLFDDFPESSSPALQVIDDVTEIADLPDSLFTEEITEIANLSDSLFDEFMDSGNVELSANQIVQQVNDETVPNDLDGDLFDNFSFEERSPNSNYLESDVTELEENNIDAIKSRIPKQSLEKLLMLINEEDQTKQLIEDKAINEDKNPNSLESDLGAVTIERILGNMETITLSGSVKKPSSDFLTLEDFSQDLGSDGF